MSKLQKIWKMAYTPILFFMGALCMWIGQIELGALCIIIATNETIKS